jgi:hypothetical protein
MLVDALGARLGSVNASLSTPPHPLLDAIATASSERPIPAGHLG